MMQDWQAGQDERIVLALRDWASTRSWNSRLMGPRPESADCQIPQGLYRRAGVQPPRQHQAEPQQPPAPSQRSLTRRDGTTNADNVTEAADRMERRENSKVAEATRMALARREQAKDIRGRVRDEILHEGGRTRMVKRVSTTADKLVSNGKINRGHKSTLETFAMLIAEALGCATLDGDDATSRLTSQYEPAGGSGYGPRSVSDRRLTALNALRKVRANIPPELVRTFIEVAAEEVGALIGKPRTLESIGHERGYLHKQASAAGGVEVSITIELVCHLMRQLDGIAADNNPRATMSQERRKQLTHQGLLEELAA